MIKVKFGKTLERFELTNQDLQTIRMMYMEDLGRTGVIGGPQMWFDVIVRFIGSQNYEIRKKNDTNGA